MRYEYAAQLSAAHRPGEISWVSCLSVSRNCKSLSKNLPPCRALLAHGDTPEANAAAPASACINFVIPLLPDGTPDWGNARNPHGVDFCASEDEARASYAADLARARRTILEHRITVDAVEARLDEIEDGLAKA